MSSQKHLLLLGGIFLIASCSPRSTVQEPTSEATESNSKPEPALDAVVAPTPTAATPSPVSTPVVAVTTPAPDIATPPADAAPPSGDPQPAATPLAHAGPVPTPHPAAGATLAAIRKYPELGKKDSMFNQAFRDLYDARKNSDPVALSKPDWPLVLAKETATMLADIPGDEAGPEAAPLAEKTGAASNDAAGKVAAAGALKKPETPEWFKKRIDQPNALEKGAYDQRQSLYPRRYYYYTDAYGRFWIDIYGHRHYY